MNIFTPRPMYAMAALGCSIILLFAFYLQYVEEMEPCPLCWFQRLAVLALAIGFGLAAWQAKSKRRAAVFASVLTVLALTGAAIAARHIWIQNLPADQVPACGQSVLYMLDNMPFFDVFTKALQGSGECAKRDTWLGFTLPSWTMFLFVLAALWAWFGVFRFKQPSFFR